MMEWWSGGVVEFSNPPILQYSTTPIPHYSIPAVMIDSYRFGEMIVDGKRYSSDLIIYPDRVDASWWRKEGHQLCLDDIQDIIAEKPECLVVGTGNPGFMRVLPETQKYLQKQGIQLISEPTERAYKTFNKLQPVKRIIGAFHLTC